MRGLVYCDPLIDRGRRLDHGDSGAAPQDSQVGFEQLPIRLLFRLDLNLARDEIHALERSEIAGQKRRCLDQAIQIDIDRIGQRGALRINDQHLPGVQEDGFADTVIAKNPAGSLENDKLDEGVRVVLEHDGGAGNRGGDGGGIDLRTAGILRNAQEHGAAAEIEIARAFVETENRVRAESGEGLVGKGELGA